jgi:hypothetical protein
LLNHWSKSLNDNCSLDELKLELELDDTSELEEELEDEELELEDEELTSDTCKLGLPDTTRWSDTETCRSRENLISSGERLSTHSTCPS